MGAKDKHKLLMRRSPIRSGDGRDAASNAVAAGIYLYQLRAGDFVQSREVVPIK